MLLELAFADVDLLLENFYRKYVKSVLRKSGKHVYNLQVDYGGFSNC